MSNAVKIYKHFQAPKVAGVYHRLICLTGEKKGIAYFILDKKRVVLGRSETADVRVLDLKSSREHAEIIQVGDDFILTDLGSQNGIIVNDLKIKQHVLSNGDKIIIGKTVYKFSRLVVKAQETEESDEEEVVDEQEVQRDKKLAKVLGVIILLAVVLYGIEDVSTEKTVKKKKDEKTVINEIDESKLISELTKKSTRKVKNKEKIERYLHRGLREYRENNFFRAYIEFDNARQWAPKDPLVNFYLRKTKEKQNEIIDSYFSKGSRDKDALNFLAAQTSYCTIVRLLLYHFPNDLRIQQARDNLREIERKTGADENSIVCTRKGKTQ